MSLLKLGTLDKFGFFMASFVFFLTVWGHLKEHDSVTHRERSYLPPLEGSATSSHLDVSTRSPLSKIFKTVILGPLTSYLLIFYLTLIELSYQTTHYDLNL